MSQTGKLKPNLDQNTTKLFNLTVLQRIDPFIDEILFTAAHVTFYEFDIDTSQWSRKDVEGSLFVVKRNAQPRFQFIVMNRRSTDNLVENLLGDFEFEVQLPYILYRNESLEVNGIWFYNSRDCEEIANLFTRILNAYSKASAKPQISSTNSEFEELEKVPTMEVMDGPLEPLPAASARTDIVDDSNFVNFFSAAANIGNKLSVSTNQKDNYQGVPNPHSYAPSVSSSSDSIPTQPSICSPPSGLPIHGSINTIRNSNSVTNLVKPSSFFQPPPSAPMLMTPSSSSAAIGQLNSPLKNSLLNGVPAVQPFRPPTPQVSHAHQSSSRSVGQAINRDKVREALIMLAKDEQFIDIVYQALMRAHNT